MKLSTLIIAAVGVIAVAVALYFAFGWGEEEIPVAQQSAATGASPSATPVPQSESGAPEPAEEPTAEPAGVAENTTSEDTGSQSTAAASGDTNTTEGTTQGSTGGTVAATAGSTQVATAPATETAPAAESVTKPAPAAPKPQASFDLVRVEKSGEAVIAGRGPVGSEVTVFDGERALGSVVVGPSGSWVVLPTSPLAPGSHHLSIRALLGDGSEVWSANSAVVEVPEPKVQVAAAPPQPAADGGEPTPASQTATTQAESTQTETAQTEPIQTGTVESGTVETGTTGAVSTQTASTGTDSPEVETAPAAGDAAEPVGPLVVLVPNNPDQASQVLQMPQAVVEEGIRQDSLSLETVDYDDTGKAVISGRATPGATIVIYLDNLAAAEVIVDAAGRWSARPEAPIAPGLHRLRVDQLGADGKVSARVETPFSRAEVAEIQVAENRVVVQPGNSLWRIARRVYGEGIRYTVIYQANDAQIGDPDLIYPGQIFNLPSSD